MAGRKPLVKEDLVSKMTPQSVEDRTYQPRYNVDRANVSQRKHIGAHVKMLIERIMPKVRCKKFKVSMSKLEREI